MFLGMTRTSEASPTSSAAPTPSEIPPLPTWTGSRRRFKIYREIESFKDKTEAARAEVVADSELDLLQKELNEVLRKEKSLIEDSSNCKRAIKDLDQQRASIEERKCALKKREKKGLREQMMLSTYASVTTVIPILTEDSNVSGYVDRKKNMVDGFQFGSASTDTCESIWRMIDEQEDRVK